MFLVSMTRAPGRVASLLLGALVLGVAAPAAAQPRSAPPSSPPPAEGEVEDPYAGEPEDPYGKPNPAPAPAPAERPATPPATPAPAERPAARPATPAPPPAPAPAERPAARPAAPDTRDPAPDARAPSPEQAIDEAVARALYERAKVLHDAGDYASAKMLLLESLSRSVDGPVAGDARTLLASCEENLGDLPSQGGDETLDPFATRDLEGTLDPFAEEQPAAAEAPVQDTGAGTSSRSTAQRTLMFYGGMYGFTAGMAIMGVESDDDPLLLALLGAGAGAAGGYLVARNGDISPAQASTIAWSGAWAGLAGGLVVDLSGIGTSTGTGVTRGVAVGGLLGTGAGWFLGKKLDPSPGDVALVNSLGLYGTATSLLIGVGLAPVEVEGYSLNALLGAGVGLAVGLWAAPRVDVSRQRMLWVDLGAALGAVTPWVLIYPAIHDSNVTSDEQTAGVLSAIGLLGGGYLSWRMTAKLDADKAAAEPAPALSGLLQHAADGGWALGVPLPRLPHNTALGPPSRGWGMAVDLVAGQF